MSQGSLTINGVQMVNATPKGWKVTDLSPLWAPPAVRGENVVIPGTAGRTAIARRVDETTCRLPMVIFHGQNLSGTPYSDPSDGLQTNVAYLYTNVVAPTIGTTVAALLTFPSGSTASASVQCELELSDHYGNSATRAVLHVTVPAGRFA